MNTPRANVTPEAYARHAWQDADAAKRAVVIGELRDNAAKARRRAVTAGQDKELRAAALEFAKACNAAATLLEVLQ